MNLNKTIPEAGAAIVTVTVLLFAGCILADFPVGVLAWKQFD